MAISFAAEGCFIIICYVSSASVVQCLRSKLKHIFPDSGLVRLQDKLRVAKTKYSVIGNLNVLRTLSDVRRSSSGCI